MDELFSADPLVTIVRNMRIIKIILYYLLLASSLYAGTAIISPLYGTGWHFSLASMYGAVFSVLFVGSDLWLHHKISRLIALSILALTYLMSFEYYLFCDEYRFVVHQGSNEKIFLADIGKFHEYWFYQGLLVAYLLLAIVFSHLLTERKLLMKQDNG